MDKNRHANGGFSSILLCTLCAMPILSRCLDVSKTGKDVYKNLIFFLYLQAQKRHRKKPGKAYLRFV